MDTTFSTNILFYILSLFITLFTIFLIVVFLYTLSIFKTVKREVEKIETDIDAIRSKVKDGGVMVSSFLMYLMSFLKKSRKKKS